MSSAPHQNLLPGDDEWDVMLRGLEKRLQPNEQVRDQLRERGDSTATTPQESANTSTTALKAKAVEVRPYTLSLD